MYSESTVFLFGAVLDECMEGNAGITLAALLEFWPGRLGVEVGLERDQWLRLSLPPQ